jgi:hypothetical protein
MSAAILLRARNNKLCILQSLIGAILYAGHASKFVYKRLNKLGVSISHTTVVKLVKSCGNNHDNKLKRWQKEWRLVLEQKSANSPENNDIEDSSSQDDTSSLESMKECSYILVGDNIDKNIKPHDMRVDHQVQSLHYFNCYAALDRIDFSRVSVDNLITGEAIQIPTPAILPNVDDCFSLRLNYIIIVANMIAEKFQYFKPLKQCIPAIPHKYEKEMCKKSNTVCLGVIPRNENKIDEMTLILQDLQRYIPHNRPVQIAFGGDQLTVERVRVCTDLRKHSFERNEQLGCFFPFAGDWHAEVTLLQVIYHRLYKMGSSQEGGTLLQLRNLINRRNVGQNVSNRFNACLDFFELVTQSHIFAAVLTFFGLKDFDSLSPSQNALPREINHLSKVQQWGIFSDLIGKLIDRYIIVRDYVSVLSDSGNIANFPFEDTSAFVKNVHCERIKKEHDYCNVPCPHGTRVLPHCLQQKEAIIPNVQLAQPDYVFSYACTVLSDGLLLYELRDAIHNGDGLRILRCWKFMLLYFKAYNHHKYSLEAFRLLAAVNSNYCSPLVQSQILWSRTVNTHGGSGRNIPVDLHNEHLNRTLKDYMHGLGANVTEERIVNISKSLQTLFTICQNADAILGIPPISLHHTSHSSEKDEKLIIEELINKSRVFEYIPGRSHRSFSNIEPCIAKAINSGKLLKWINDQKNKLNNDIEFLKYLS